MENNNQTEKVEPQAAVIYSVSAAHGNHETRELTSAEDAAGYFHAIDANDRPRVIRTQPNNSSDSGMVIAGTWGKGSPGRPNEYFKYLGGQDAAFDGAYRKLTDAAAVQAQKRLVASEQSEGGAWQEQAKELEKLRTFFRQHYGAEISPARAKIDEPGAWEGMLVHKTGDKGFLLHPAGVAEVPAKIDNRVLEVGEWYRVAKNGPEGTYEIIDRDAVERLMHSWLGGPTWDIENTLGFEPFKEELAKFRHDHRDADEYEVLQDKESGMVGLRKANETTKTYFGGIPAIQNFAQENPGVPERVINELLAREGGYTSIQECRDADGYLVLNHKEGYRWVFDADEDALWARGAKSAVKHHGVTDAKIRASQSTSNNTAPGGPGR